MPGSDSQPLAKLAPMLAASMVSASASRVITRRAVASERVSGGRCHWVHPSPSGQVLPVSAGNQSNAAPRSRRSSRIRHCLKFRFQLVQIQHVRCRIFLLRVGQGFGPPVGCLLLLGHVDADQFLQQVFQPVPVGKGADQFCGDLGAPDRGGGHAKGGLQGRHVKAAKVEQLDRVQDRSAVVPDLALSVCPRMICTRCALPSPDDNCTRHRRSRMRVQAHGFGINRHHGAKVQAIGQIVAVKVNGHAVFLVDALNWK